MRDEASRPVFPACLLLDGRRCLVVGGGKIAEHKVRLLLEARARVTVVAPEVCEALRELRDAGKVEVIERAFAPDDLAGTTVVFAATDDRAVNRLVLDHCRERGVLACAVDKGWTVGDFVTPATFRRDNLTVAVTTGGQSCRRSRLIKNSLMRHVDMLESADLLVLGTSHNYLSLEERAPFHLSPKAMTRTGTMLMQVWGVHEFMLLNTCSRVELLAVVTTDRAVDLVLERVMGVDRLPADRYYVKRGFDAFAHLAFTTAGLLSPNPGEQHIAGQVETALEFATAPGWAASMMREWLAAAVHIAKHIRADTGSLLAPREIEDICLDYLLAQCPDLRRRRALVLGSGAVGRGCVERLVAQGSRCDWLYHSRKPEVPAAWAEQVRLGDLNALRECLGAADVIVCATASPGFVLHPGHMPFLDQQKTVRMLDLAVPRNIAPELDRMIANATIADLDGLRRWCGDRTGSLARVFELSNGLALEHRDLYDKLVRSFQSNSSAT